MNSRMYYSEQAKSRAQSERAVIALVFLILGLSIGAAIALLFAPESGSEMRGQLAEGAKEFRDYVN